MRPIYTHTIDHPQEHIYTVLRLVLLCSLLSSANQDVPILTLRVPVVPFMAGIFGCFCGAVGSFFSVLFFFFFHGPKSCDRREAAELHGEDADSPGCQHSQPAQSPKRQLPFVAAGSLHYQRWLAGLPQVLFPFTIDVSAENVWWLLNFITHAATLSGRHTFPPHTRTDSRARAHAHGAS